MILLAVILAVVGALGLAVGTHLQHRAVRSDAGQVALAEHCAPARHTPSAVQVAPIERAGTAHRAVTRAMRTPLWLLGAGIIVLQTALNVVALGLAPVAVVQPIGSLALVCAAIISARTLGVRIGGGLMAGIALAVAAVALFVGISAGYALDLRATAAEAALLCGLLLALIVLGVLVARRRSGHLSRVVGAGVIFGSVASAMHVVAVEVFALLRAEPTGDVSPPLLAVLFVLLLGATAVGAWLVQTAYASGPPETVLAGLTVLDPLVAVLIGGLLLGEIAGIPPVALIGLLLSGIAACAGIAAVVRSHPGIGAPGDGAAVMNGGS